MVPWLFGETNIQAEGCQSGKKGKEYGDGGGSFDSQAHQFLVSSSPASDQKLVTRARGGLTLLLVGVYQLVVGDFFTQRGRRDGQLPGSFTDIPAQLVEGI